MFCKFTMLEGNVYRCDKCGIVLYSSDGMPPNFICKSYTVKQEIETDLSFVQKIKNFAKASVEHLANGAKLANEKTILTRYNTCQNCEFFVNNTCNKCGCPLFSDKKYISKLSWAEQSCPVGKWGPEQTT